MLKFLRKYNQYILVCGGVLLMVAFLVPGALRQLGQNPDRVVVFTIDGHKVRTLDDLYTALEGATVGQTVTVTVRRDGQEQNISVTLGPSTRP